MYDGGSIRRWPCAPKKRLLPLLLLLLKKGGRGILVKRDSGAAPNAQRGSGAALNVHHSYKTTAAAPAFYHNQLEAI